MSTINAQNLPSDIMRELFEHLAVVNPAGWSHDLGEYTLGWIIVTHICRRWRELGIGFATLWADAVSAFPRVSVADAFLARAGDCPINLVVGQVRAEPYESDTFRPRLPIEWGIKHLHRAHTFHCIQHSSALVRAGLDVRVALTEPLPFLKHLIINLDFEEIELPQIIDLRAPAIISASFRNVLPRLSSEIHSLKLSVDGMTRLNGMPPILDVLRSLTRLVDLDLRITPYARHEAVAANPVAVQLKYLESFHGLCCNERETSDLLELIVAPHAVKFTMMMCKNLSEHIISKVVAQQNVRALTEGLSISGAQLSFWGAPPLNARLDFSWHQWGMPNYLDQLAALARHTDLSVFLRCELWCRGGESHWQLETANEAEAAIAATRALSRVETLVMYDVASPAAIRTLLSCADESSVPFPALHTLILGADGPNTFKGHHESESRSAGGDTTSWWDNTRDVLANRSRRNAAVHRLVLAGLWCEREGWIDIWTSQSAECRAQGLVSEVVDERVLISRCDWCS